MILKDGNDPCKIENWKSWAKFNLGIEIHGRISNDGSKDFLESDLNQPKLKEANNLATILARTIENIFDLGDQAVQPRIRYLDNGNETVQLQIHLLVADQDCQDKDKLIKVLKQFSGELLATADVFSTSADTSPSTIEDPLICNAVSEFLCINGGKTVSRAIALTVDDTPVATLAGMWRPSTTVDTKVSDTIKLEALYDGRRLRARTMYVFVASPRTRSLEIYYDEDRFGTQLCALHDEKNAMLSLVLREITDRKGKPSYELVSFECINPPDELELT